MSTNHDAEKPAAQQPDEKAEEATQPYDLAFEPTTPAASLPPEPISELPSQRPYSVYTQWQKRFIVLAASWGAFFSPLTAQIYLPALNVIAADFGITATQVNLTVTTYMILQGIAPMFVGGLADTAGRRPAYFICFALYILANILLAETTSYAGLLVLRCLQSAGSSSTVALCQAVVADIITSAERGQYIGITVIPIVLAPSLGPVLGGILSQYLGWRSIFWFLTILAGVTFALFVLFFPETCRAIVDDGSVRPHAFYRTAFQLLREAHARRKVNKAAASDDPDNVLHRTSTSATGKPLKFQAPNLLASLTILAQKEIGLLLFYSSIAFAGFYTIATAMPSQLARNYGFNDLVIGLMYLPIAGGSLVAAFVMGPAINWNYWRHARRLGVVVDKARQQDLADFPIEKARLEIGIPLLYLSAAVLLGWGWAMEGGTPVAVPCVLLFLLGVGMVGFSNATSVLLVDVSPWQVGAATAANNLTRCLLGAGASAVIIPLINKIGSGWAFVLVGALYIVFSPLMFLIMWKGMGWRKELSEKKAKKANKELNSGIIGA